VLKPSTVEFAQQKSPKITFFTACALAASSSRISWRLGDQRAKKKRLKPIAQTAKF
jgi:hypothetical protein